MYTFCKFQVMPKPHLNPYPKKLRRLSHLPDQFLPHFLLCLLHRLLGYVFKRKFK